MTELFNGIQSHIILHIIIDSISQHCANHGKPLNNRMGSEI